MWLSKRVKERFTTWWEVALLISYTLCLSPCLILLVVGRTLSVGDRHNYIERVIKYEITYLPSVLHQSRVWNAITVSLLYLTTMWLSKRVKERFTAWWEVALLISCTLCLRPCLILLVVSRTLSVGVSFSLAENLKEKR